MLSMVGLLFAYSAGVHSGEYADVPEGIGANLPSAIFGIVAVAVAFGAVRRAPALGRRGKGLAVAAIVIACLTVVLCIVHVIGLAVSSN